MVGIFNLSLENEMDLVLAHKRSMKAAERLGLTMSTQTSFATAVSEISRSVIEHTNDGVLDIGVLYKDERYFLVADISYDLNVRISNADEGFYYAQKLMPDVEVVKDEKLNRISMKLGVPRSKQLDASKINLIREYFKTELPINSYEEIKNRNQKLNLLTDAQEEEIKQSKSINEKKNEFISMASHEFKTPITIIKAYAQMAKAAKDQCSAEVSAILEKIDLQSAKLVALVQQFLDISKIENGEIAYDKVSTSLNPFINDMVTVMKNIIPSHRIDITLSEDVNVFVDRLRMEQVFSNLLTNAAKYSAADTTIFISSRIENDAIRIKIKDQGIGMSKESMKQVFEKFYRDEGVVKTYPGLGIGLFIASRIVNDHGGIIGVESEEKVGSTFYFTIPVDAATVA